MAYATISDLKARAGALSVAWGSDTAPGDGDLERFIDQTAAELDAAIGALGYSLPISDTLAIDALVGVNADMALLLGIDATWPGSSGDVHDLREQVADRVLAYRDSITNNSLSALLYLGQTASAQAESGASNYWSKDAALDYYVVWWDERVGRMPRTYGLDPWGVPVTQGPEFARGMRL